MKTHKVFVASAEDVVELRAATKKVLENLNRGTQSSSKFDSWMWEHDKKHGFYDDMTLYQNAVFKEFGEHCDIFIILFWKKLGDGTKIEYEHFKNVFRKNNPNITFIACHYAKPIDFDDISEDSLNFKKWLKIEQPHWAALGGRWGAIRNVKNFEEELRVALLKYIS